MKQRSDVLDDGDRLGPNLIFVIQSTNEAALSIENSLFKPDCVGTTPKDPHLDKVPIVKVGSCVIATQPRSRHRVMTETTNQTLIPRLENARLRIRTNP